MNAFRASLEKGGIAFDVDGLARRRNELEERLSDPSVWSNRERAKELTVEIKKIKTIIEPWMHAKKEVDELYELFFMALEENEESLEEEIARKIKSLAGEIDALEKISLFGGDHDESNAYLTIHSGAGGTESCDWAAMLLRMYLKWAEKNGFKTEIVDILPGEEAGVKSVTVYVKGPYAYGYLKTEIGVHRLVRISPFDSNARRHTSFASVFCIPEVEEDIEVQIDPKDLKIDTYRSQGAGGQHVNTTDSAVRITHIPTGIVVQCQNERSQHKNKDMAMKMLHAKLYERQRMEMDREKDVLEKSKKDISWGNQIRSYVFQPYTLVKDLRTGVETGNGAAVLNGDIDLFIEAALKKAV